MPYLKPKKQILVTKEEFEELRQAVPPSTVYGQVLTKHKFHGLADDIKGEVKGEVKGDAELDENLGYWRFEISYEFASLYYYLPIGYVPFKSFREKKEYWIKGVKPKVAPGLLLTPTYFSVEEFVELRRILRYWEQLKKYHHNDKLRRVQGSKPEPQDPEAKKKWKRSEKTRQKSYPITLPDKRIIELKPKYSVVVDETGQHYLSIGPRRHGMAKAVKLNQLPVSLQGKNLVFGVPRAQSISVRNAKGKLSSRAKKCEERSVTFFEDTAGMAVPSSSPSPQDVKQHRKSRLFIPQLPGITLGDLISQPTFAKWPWKKKYSLALACAKALEGIHAQNKVHCDLNPRGNLIVEERNGEFIVRFVDGDNSVPRITEQAFKQYRLAFLSCSLQPELLTEYARNAYCVKKVKSFPAFSQENKNTIYLKPHPSDPTKLQYLRMGEYAHLLHRGEIQQSECLSYLGMVSKISLNSYNYSTAADVYQLFMAALGRALDSTFRTDKSNLYNSQVRKFEEFLLQRIYSHKNNQLEVGLPKTAQELYEAYSHAPGKDYGLVNWESIQLGLESSEDNAKFSKILNKASYFIGLPQFIKNNLELCNQFFAGDLYEGENAKSASASSNEKKSIGPELSEIEKRVSTMYFYWDKNKDKKWIHKILVAYYSHLDQKRKKALDEFIIWAQEKVNQYSAENTDTQSSEQDWPGLSCRNYQDFFEILLSDIKQTWPSPDWRPPLIADIQAILENAHLDEKSKCLKVAYLFARSQEVWNYGLSYYKKQKIFCEKWTSEKVVNGMLLNGLNPLHKSSTKASDYTSNDERKKLAGIIGVNWHLITSPPYNFYKKISSALYQAFWHALLAEHVDKNPSAWWSLRYFFGVHPLLTSFSVVDQTELGREIFVRMANWPVNLFRNIMRLIFLWPVETCYRLAERQLTMSWSWLLVNKPYCKLDRFWQGLNAIFFIVACIVFPVLFLAKVLVKALTSPFYTASSVMEKVENWCKNHGFSKGATDFAGRSAYIATLFLVVLAWAAILYFVPVLFPFLSKLSLTSTGLTPVFAFFSKAVATIASWFHLGSAAVWAPSAATKVVGVGATVLFTGATVQSIDRFLAPSSSFSSSSLLGGRTRSKSTPEPRYCDMMLSEEVKDSKDSKDSKEAAVSPTSPTSSFSS